MIQAKVRCEYCGAKNTDITKDRCRICGGLLPDAAERRKQTSDGDTFKALVEAEVESWQEFSELGTGSRSRRPAELPPVFAQTAVPGQDMTAGAPVPESRMANGNGHDYTNRNGHTNGHDGDGAEGGGRLRRLRLFSKSDD
jgi:ribosomal protein L37E